MPVMELILSSSVFPGLYCVYTDDRGGLCSRRDSMLVQFNRPHGFNNTSHDTIKLINDNE